MTKEFEFNDLGSGGKAIIKLNDNSLTISRPGFVSKLSHGFSGEKTIMYNQISAVQVKKAGVSRGYIQFVIAGSKEAKSGILGNNKDENTIYFASTFNNSKVNSACDEIKNTIEQYNANISNGVVIEKHEDDVYDKIAKLKKLLDADAITQEEYDKEKSKLLNQL